MEPQPPSRGPWPDRKAITSVPRVFTELIPSWDWLEPLILDVLTAHPYAWDEGRCLCLPEGKTMRHPEWREHVVDEITRRGKQALRGTR